MSLNVYDSSGNFQLSGKVFEYRKQIQLTQ